MRTEEKKFPNQSEVEESKVDEKTLPSEVVEEVNILREQSSRVSLVGELKVPLKTLPGSAALFKGQRGGQPVFSGIVGFFRDESNAAI